MSTIHTEPIPYTFLSPLLLHSLSAPAFGNMGTSLPSPAFALFLPHAFHGEATTPPLLRRAPSRPSRTHLHTGLMFCVRLNAPAAPAPPCHGQFLSHKVSRCRYPNIYNRMLICFVGACLSLWVCSLWVYNSQKRSRNLRNALQRARVFRTKISQPSRSQAHRSLIKSLVGASRSSPPPCHGQFHEP